MQMIRANEERAVLRTLFVRRCCERRPRTTVSLRPLTGDRHAPQERWDAPTSAIQDRGDYTWAVALPSHFTERPGSLVLVATCECGVQTIAHATVIPRQLERGIYFTTDWVESICDRQNCECERAHRPHPSCRCTFGIYSGAPNP